MCERNQKSMNAICMLIYLVECCVFFPVLIARIDSKTNVAEFKCWLEENVATNNNDKCKI